MLIGIDASRAFLRRRTGIEEYSYQVIKHLRQVLSPDTEVRLYMRPGQGVDFSLPQHWKIKRLWSPRYWTQLRLSLELLLHPVETLFVPAHTVPLIHPRNTVVTVHGLEYERSPQSYVFSDRWYMRLSIRFSCRVAKTIIAVSESTKRDLIRFYRVPERKIRVVHEGVEKIIDDGRWNLEGNQATLRASSSFDHLSSSFFLFIGRLETRKNIVRIIEAFERFKEKTGLPHQLVLVGKPGYGYEKLKNQLSKIKFRNEIHELGYVSETAKQELLKGAVVFVFPSLAEGFGLPVLEAQAAGVPVLTSNVSSLPEVAGEGALFVDPTDTAAIAEAMERLATDQRLRADIIEKAFRNAERFSWARCAREVATLLLRCPS